MINKTSNSLSKPLSLFELYTCAGLSAHTELMQNRKKKTSKDTRNLMREKKTITALTKFS